MSSSLAKPPSTNAIGWEVVCPFAILAYWEGGESKARMSFIGPGARNVEFTARPSGAFAVYLPFILQTSPGWSVCIRGVPNSPGKANAVPLARISHHG